MCLLRGLRNLKGFRRDLHNLRYLQDMWLHRLHQFFQRPLGILGFWKWTLRSTTVAASTVPRSGFCPILLVVFARPATDRSPCLTPRSRSLLVLEWDHLHRSLGRQHLLRDLRNLGHLQRNLRDLQNLPTATMPGSTTAAAMGVNGCGFAWSSKRHLPSLRSPGGIC